MALITFYEKPGCKGNARQKALLAAAGHTVQAKSLKTETWSRARLFSFLSPLPVGEWFNRSAPAVKAGQIVPEHLSVDEALTVLIANPLLIRRPLMEVGDERRVGFDTTAVDAWIGLNGAVIPEGNLEACVHGPDGHGSCGGHEDGAGAGDALSPNPSPASGRGEHSESRGDSCGTEHGRCGSH